MMREQRRPHGAGGGGGGDGDPAASDGVTSTIADASSSSMPTVGMSMHAAPLAIRSSAASRVGEGRPRLDRPRLSSLIGSASLGSIDWVAARGKTDSHSASVAGSTGCVPARFWSSYSIIRSVMADGRRRAREPSAGVSASERTIKK
jgi:hypothetical protein